MGRSASSIILVCSVSEPVPAQCAGADRAGTAHRKACPAATSAGSDARLYIIYPWDGAQIRGEFWVRFGLRNMGGDAGRRRRAECRDITTSWSTSTSRSIRKSRFRPTTSIFTSARGQTEARLELPPGKHTLQLVLGDAGAPAIQADADLEESHHNMCSPTSPAKNLQERQRGRVLEAGGVPIMSSRAIQRPGER